MELIDKAAVVAEIERLKADALQKKSQCKRSGLERIMHQIGAYNKVLSFLDTLEVAEVDLEKELEDFLEKNSDSNGFFNPLDVAKHFFKLGMAVNNKAQKGE